MNEMTIVYGVVLGAAAFLALRWMPAGLKTRFGLGGDGGSCATKSSCGSKDCDGCH